jgi:nitrile hydratase
MHDTHHHSHEAPPDCDAPGTYHQVLETAVRELLIEKGVFGGSDLRRTIEAMDARSPAVGARVVARAWVDPSYQERLLADGSAAVRELGIDVGATRLIAVANTPQVHNLVVCTLCSCYPRMLLGLPPDWYKSRAYRARGVREPRALLAEFGTVLAEDVEVRVHDSTAEMRYLVVPSRPTGTEDLDEAALAALVTRDSMIGVALARDPGTV